MWEKREHQTSTAIARPMRVAYLIDLSDCPNELLDSIFAESYSRWGGRRTPVIPATADGIDQRYVEWLTNFDADVIYSFVPLSDAAIEAIHEKYAPAYLTHHKTVGIDQDGVRSFHIKLPYPGLSCLSVLPAICSRSWDYRARPNRVTVLDRFWDRSESKFLAENFGFLSQSFSNHMFAGSYPELIDCLTMITPESLADQRLGKDENADYQTEEGNILDALGEREKRWLLPLANLSEAFTLYQRSENDLSFNGMNIVAGDAILDRLLFWNGHNGFDRPGFGEITSLRIAADRLGDDDFLKRIQGIIDRRGISNANGRNDAVALRSTSLDMDTLECAAEALRNAGNGLSVRTELVSDSTGYVPTFYDGGQAFLSGGNIFDEQTGRSSTEYLGDRVPVPMATPWHIQEAFPPAGLRNGNWMVDVTIERLVDHCPHVNQRHAWLLPRRLRIECAFGLELESDGWRNPPGKFIRPMRSGAFGVALNVDVQTAVITIPDDLDAFVRAICNDMEWRKFDRTRENAPIGRRRFYRAELSDKGRYLLGIFQLFNTVPDAFNVMMNGYWRDVFHKLGASPIDKDAELPGRLIKAVRRRMRQPNGPLLLETDDDQLRLAREALRIARGFRREQRYVRYAWLKEQWLEIVKSFLDNGSDSLDDAYYSDERQLTNSIQYACQHEVLFQGREWQCQNCFNRPWVGIEALGRTITCDVCGRSNPAPVTDDWHFRANPFILEAYREHNSEVPIWALWRLSERARESFYFAPSLKLWLERPEQANRQCDVEIDAVAVVDGMLYLIEATASDGLNNSEIRQLAVASELIRPDVMLVACMAETEAAAGGLNRRLQEQLPDGIRSEVLIFDPVTLDRYPYLPS